MRGLMKILLLLFAIAIILTGCTPGASQEDLAAVYCEKNMGKVETRYPFYDTNSQHPLLLSGAMKVCTFTAADQSSRIIIALDTLYTDKPTLAALAYLGNKPGEAIPPASEYCSNLGGSDRFGRLNDAGGGWGNQNKSDVVFLCIFPDHSAIDSWALADHARGVIQGADLGPLLRYQPDQSSKPFQ